MKKSASLQRFKFQSTDSVITTLVALSSEPTIRYELSFSHALDNARLLAALKALLRFEPVLSCRLVLDHDPHFELQELDDSELLFITDSPEAYAAFKQAPIQVQQGPLAAFGLYRRADGDTLLFKLAHEAADGFGLAAAVSFVADHYRDPKAAESRIRAPHELSRSPKRLIKQFGLLDYPKLAWLNIKEKVGYFLPAGTMAYHAGDAGLIQPAFVTHEIGGDTVKSMRDFAKKHNASLNDMLLAAFLRAMAKKVDFKGDKALRILLTINLRRYMARSTIPSSEICNLSAMECVNIKRDLGKTLTDTLRKVTDVTQAKKKAGIGLSFLLDLVINEKLKFETQRKMNQSTRDMVMKTENFAVTVTNVGEVNPSTICFDERPSNVEIYGPLAYAPFWCFAVYELDGKLKISVAVDSRRVGLLNALFDAVDGEIRAALA